MTDRALHQQRVVDAVQAVRRLPSLSAGVLRAGELSWTGSAGAGGGADVQYRIGSLTKIMTAVLVLRCRDEGLLGLDDRLEHWLPESAHRDATLRQLLSHTAGALSEPAGEWWERTPGRDITDLVAENFGQVWLPGTDFHYSNLGYALLGEVVRRVFEASWADLVRDQIFTPLGMSRTSMLPMEPAQRGYSVHHLRGTLSVEPSTDTGGMAAAGQVWSTVQDLAKFAGFLLRGDDGVLARETLVQMSRRQPAAADYGLGLMTRGPMIGHLGSMPGFQSSLFVDPASGDGVVALTNSTTGFAGVDFTQRMLGVQTPGDGEPWVPTEQVPAWAEELLGYWHWGNSAYEVRWHNSRLEFFDLARGLLAEQFELVDARIIGHAGYHRGEQLHVVRDGEGSINHLNCATFIYTRVPYDAAAPIPGGTGGMVGIGEP